MKREDAKILLERGIFQAYAEGKTIQVFGSSSIWIDTIDPLAFGLRPDEYRIKPEPEYRPFTNEEAPEIVGRVVKQKCSGAVSMLIGWSVHSSVFATGSVGSINCKSLLESFVFYDNSPCGVLKNDVQS